MLARQADAVALPCDPTGVTRIGHWIGGDLVRGIPSAVAEVRNPETGLVTGQVSLATREETAQAVQAAADAFPAWREAALSRRTQVVFAFRELLNARKHELAAIITAEHGKVLSEALGEVSRGQELDAYSIRQPVGPVAVISPVRLPYMVPMGFVPVAIASGNTVVLKPSEQAPSGSLWIAELWREAGLPDGVFNVIQGDEVAVHELLTNPAIKAVSFVGSTPAAHQRND
jgi:malonate-semialdehyde dehydrogenase (acetylating) / methylmalonate-semialdehyde dehydrogenase